ncbi:MAG: P-II family nitrogen regulator, partial [Caldimonas sp.]
TSARPVRATITEEPALKPSTAIIQPHMLETVDHGLRQLPHFPGFTMWRGRGESRGSDAGPAWHPATTDIAGHPDVVLLIACADEIAPAIVQTIQRCARTGCHGDGLITVLTRDDVVRIRTDEHGDSAV